MPLPNHLFVSHSDGALYDTRAEGWSELPPLRPNYHMRKRKIESVADVKAALRSGPYAWPGGYPLYFAMRDGAALSFDSVRGELKRVVIGMASGDRDWTPIAVEVNWEDTGLYCAHSNARIECAYPSDDDDDDDDNEG